MEFNVEIKISKPLSHPMVILKSAISRKRLVARMGENASLLVLKVAWRSVLDHLQIDF